LVVDRSNEVAPRLRASRQLIGTEVLSVPSALLRAGPEALANAISLLDPSVVMIHLIDPPHRLVDLLELLHAPVAGSRRKRYILLTTDRGGTSVVRSRVEALVGAQALPVTPDELVEAALTALREQRRTDPAGAVRGEGVTPRRAAELTRREREVLSLLTEGATNGQIAEVLLITQATARFHVASLLGKLGARNRTQAVTLAHRRGWL
jgi:DNA-binding NarL/FixJ family response regulator